MPRSPEIEHHYGDNVHILDDPLARSLLSKLCAQETIQPTINRLVATLYQQMVCTVISDEMPTRVVTVPTRMIEHTPRGVWQGSIVDPRIKVAVVCVARAGIFPSQVCYDFLNEIIEPSLVRLGSVRRRVRRVKSAALALSTTTLALWPWRRRRAATRSA